MRYLARNQARVDLQYTCTTDDIFISLSNAVTNRSKYIINQIVGQNRREIERERKDK